MGRSLPAGIRGQTSKVRPTGGAEMNDTGKVALTFFGSIIFCAAIVGTVQSLMQGGQGGGPAVGGTVTGIGLGLLLIPWLRDEPLHQRRSDEQDKRRHINAA